MSHYQEHRHGSDPPPASVGVLVPVLILGLTVDPLIGGRRYNFGNGHANRKFRDQKYQNFVAAGVAAAAQRCHNRAVSDLLQGCPRQKAHGLTGTLPPGRTALLVKFCRLVAAPLANDGTGEGQQAHSRQRLIWP